MTRLTIKRLHPLFVAEVTGIDLTLPIPRKENGVGFTFTDSIEY